MDKSIVLVSGADLARWREEGNRTYDVLKANPNIKVQGLWWEGKKDGKEIPTDKSLVRYYFPAFETEYGVKFEGYVTLVPPPKQDKLVLKSKAEVLEAISDGLIADDKVSSVLKTLQNNGSVTILVKK